MSMPDSSGDEAIRTGSRGTRKWRLGSQNFNRMSFPPILRTSNTFRRRHLLSPLKFQTRRAIAIWRRALPTISGRLARALDQYAGVIEVVPVSVPGADRADDRPADLAGDDS
jgi:hypothetical protein